MTCLFLFSASPQQLPINTTKSKTQKHTSIHKLLRPKCYANASLVPRTRSTALSSPADDQSTIDPLLRETRQRAGRTEENGEEIENDDDEQDSIDDEAVKLLFFSRANRPKGNICPFSHPPRENPCTTHNRSMSRKNVIRLGNEPSLAEPEVCSVRASRAEDPAR